MSESKHTPERDCEHGQLASACDQCADARELQWIADLVAEVDRLRAERDELKATLEVPARFAATLMRLIRAAHEAEPAIAQAYGTLLADKMDAEEGPGRGRHVRSLLQDLATGEPPRTVTLQDALAAERRKVEALREALRFYAQREHFALSDANAWDTVSGEPQNYWCDDAGTATVEDGATARAALASTEGGAK